ncbi:MAG: Gx transporter family protein [Gammaproteobacteria bacterium]|nr:Gx transporter family protein [Gammaproteobacteria bacterium]NIR28331.1 Gx transporter family protein [Gammaproteobacteria bacterium]NIR96745.1 Gx transporter family protein [Gammaproteobacteria bacterium]NIT62447.1 Gx transporter family protein [Gammaproteobacteria bacterium]NIV19380.1 heptaprenyl diphosphate synthase [Gammaproteobacteria bacterium]
MKTLTATREDHLVAWLAALAIAIHVAEAALPSPLPGVKPGLANVVTIAVLVCFGWRLAAWVSMLRILAGSLLIGTFLSPTFLLSFAGAVASVAVLGVAVHLPGRGFGPVGYSVLAGMAHMGGQFTLAYWLLIPHPGLLALLPVLMTASVFFGVVNGIIVRILVRGR